MIKKCLEKALLLGVTLALSAAIAPPAFAQLEPTGEPPAATGWRAETDAEGIPKPWGIAWLPDGWPLITSKEGRLHILNGKRLDAIPLEGLPPIFTGGQGGLFDIALHPGDKANPRVYLTMRPGPRATTARSWSRVFSTASACMASRRCSASTCWRATRRGNWAPTKAPSCA